MYSVAYVISSSFEPPFRKRAVRVATVGLGVALLIVAGGRAIEQNLFGDGDVRALDRVERELRERLDRTAADLNRTVAAAGASSDLLRASPHDPAAVQTLFERLDTTIAEPLHRRAGVTIYDAASRPLAWAGRASDIPRARIEGASALFVAQGAFGPRLVQVEPILDADRRRDDAEHRSSGPSSATNSAAEHRTGRRLGTIVAEQLLGEPHTAADADQLRLNDLFVPVQLRPGNPIAARSAYSLPIRTSAGAVLGQAADVRPADVSAARGRWRAGVRAAALTAVALTLVVFVGLVIDHRARQRGWGAALGATLALIGLLAAIRFLLGSALTAFAGSTLITPTNLLLNAAFLLALVVLAADVIEAWRLSRPRRRLVPPGTGALVRTATAYLVAGVAGATLLLSYERFLERVIVSTTIDPLRFSLPPFSADRLSMAFGLVLLHAAVIWSAALIIRFAGQIWRVPALPSRRPVAVFSWIAGVVVAVGVGRALQPDVPSWSLVAALAASAACAIVLAAPGRRLRKASQAARIFGLYVALLIPSLAAYPALHAFAVQAKEHLVAGTFGPEASNLRDDLQRELASALEQIDSNPGLTALFEAPAEEGSAATNRAYSIWSQTALRRSRVTSSVELYGRQGELLSRFALNLPEYELRLPATTGCRLNQPQHERRWDVFEDVSHVLQASRSVCDNNQIVGTLVVRAMLDYRTLPFIASQSPYFESLRPDLASPEVAPGRDVDFAMYGWSRAPIFSSGGGAWRLSDEVFSQLVAARDPFWHTVLRDDQSFRVYFLSDRGGIYALSYPVITMFGHLMNLAELVILTGALYVLLLLAAWLLNLLSARRPASGPALLREVRSSFYRKLFLAFVAVAVIPATILAFATRNRLARQFDEGVNENAVKTATVAQRLVEDYAALQPGGQALDGLDDSNMVLVGRAIDQDVNLYNGSSLQATSERDLFASGLFQERTPADVYRSVILDRLPTFVSTEDIGGFNYLLAAAPVRAGGGDRIVTVPQTLQKRELELQIDELDRRVWSSFVLFVLLGAGLGYWMAERIADPVSRLTRATRRIARGDLDARIAATSSDELRRLVEDFNRMAADLKRQRSELERTQRLEAWADMARQVAHDIKNPLTPIQLSAEHARRVNVDRGRPLSPVLDECVTAILNQVTLLRQISAEFSSFGSSPTPRPESTGLRALVDEVTESYRVGLAGRVQIDIDIAPDLPAVTIDRTLFSRALTNVIENALHAMPGQGRLAITAKLDPQAPGRVVMTIADTGVGMDREALARIFEPYFSTKATGTGLGLTIARRNVVLSGGTIAVDSQRGVGTTVTITLPTAA